MAKYVTLYSFTDQGVRAIKDTPGRARGAIEAAQKAGMKVHGLYYTQGPYDVVVVSEADDDKMAAAFALATASQGNVKSITMRAWDVDEFEEIVGLMP
ncbi:MAG TPA: GYD domain-containing protein [Longimicrobiales bacterium]|jgi:uncharacterized protein with GYD domain|nr:GYD domain-containing protein [Longimicrobiales bacterium]